MRILLTQSVSDDLAKRRMRRLRRSPTLKNHSLDNFVIWPSSNHDFAKMRSRLDKKIRDFSPDVVIVHGGMAYLEDRQAYISVMNDLIDEHRSVRFIAEGFIKPEDGFKGQHAFELLDEDFEIYRLVMEFVGLRIITGDD